jgi:hypothetical protein
MPFDKLRANGWIYGELVSLPVHGELVEPCPTTGLQGEWAEG